jgi:hypothetical protein
MTLCSTTSSKSDQPTTDGWRRVADPERGIAGAEIGPIPEDLPRQISVLYFG